MKKVILAAFLSLIALPAYCGQMSLLGAGKVATAVAYSGPGDVVSAATVWASCARAYTAAYAATLGNLCRVTRTSDSTQCILKVTASGFADLTSVNCNGNTQTIVQFCNATTCAIDTAYDQTGNALDYTQGTAAQRPTLTFSALNGLPGITCASASSQRLDTPQTSSYATNMSFSAVAKRTANFTTSQSVIGGQPAYPTGIGFTTSANTARVTSNTIDLSTGGATDSTFHSINGVIVNAGTSIIDVDGASNTGSVAAGAQVNQGFRICRDQGGQFPLDGVVMEVGVWISTALSSGQVSSLQTNQHSTNSYCAINGCTLP